MSYADALIGRHCADTSDGKCPQALAKLAIANDTLWYNQFETDPQIRKNIEEGQIIQLADSTAVLYEQYGLDPCNVTWEDIQQKVRAGDGGTLSRGTLAEFGYKRKPIWKFSDGVNEALDGIPTILTDFVPIDTDKWMHPGAVLIAALFASLFIFLVLAACFLHLTEYPMVAGGDGFSHDP